MTSSWSAAGPSDDARHLSYANIDAVWSARNPVVLPIAGTPPCRLVIRPVHATISLITQFVPPEPDVTKLRNISFRRTTSDEGDLAELTVVVEDNVHGVYGLLATVADQLQLDSVPFAAAVSTAVKKHRSLFASEVGLSIEKEIGLFGELLVLERLIAILGAESAVSAWQGPVSEEHDFVLGKVHLEVKTTVSEHRRHMMHGFTQLVPLRGVPLSLISIMLTRSIGDAGRTLAQLVIQIRGCAGGYRPRIDECLETLGWRDGDAELYATFWTERDARRAYKVDERFPAITLERLRQVVPNVEAVSELSYRIDLTHFAPDTLPDPLADLVEIPKE